MGQFREKMRSARRDLHDYMSVPALYFAWPLNGAAPKEISVRVHEKFTALGDMKGTSYSYAEVEEDSPRIVFMRDEFATPPARNMYVSVEPGLAFLIDHLLPPDDITVTAQVKRLSPAEAVGMPVPGTIFVSGNLEFPGFGL